MTAAVPLYEYQKRWLLDRSRFKIGMFARQTGKTFTTTLEIVDDIFAEMAKGRRVRWVILSRGERQSKEAINEGVKVHAQAYNLAFESIDSSWDIGGTSYKSQEVEFPNGSRIIGLPANADTARGFSANVYLDEFAIHKDSREIWKALFPVISAGWKLRVTSTPKGKGNKFYELMTAEDDTWSRHTVDIYQAVAQGLPRDVDALRAGLADEEAWQQEYELKWLDEAAAWLTYDQILAVEHPEAGKPDNYAGGLCFAGNDIAIRGDLWVFWVWELVGDVLWERERKILRRSSFAEQDAVMDEMFRKYRIVRLCMDQTGMGEKPVEDAKRRHGAGRVEGVIFTPAAKLNMAIAAKQRFEDKTCRITEGDIVLRADLHKLQKVVGPTGIPRLVAERDGAGHADQTWAGFLGIAAAGGDAQPAAGESIDPTPGDFRVQDRPSFAGRFLSKPTFPFKRREV